MRFFIFAILLSAVTLSCHKECARTLQLSASIYPRQEVYHIGDTIRVISKFHRLVHGFDSHASFSGKKVGEYDLGGLHLGPLTALADMHNRLNQKVFETQFDFFIDSTNSAYQLFADSQGTTQLAGEYSYVQDTFYLGFSLIPKDTGLFILVQSSFEYQTRFFDFPGKCKGPATVGVLMNQGMGNNQELLKESSDPFFNTRAYNDQASEFDVVGGYCFRVVE